ncbi:MAG TPA: L-seryl-tRNA(Sec) selenium transferase [Firmicutes bacterium]|nr:L-seryl-tRNA(Sec) selenium transferase [Bacillota bacterium]
MPSVSSVLEHPVVKSLLDERAPAIQVPAPGPEGQGAGTRRAISRLYIAECVRGLIEDLRERIKAGRISPHTSREEMFEEILEGIRKIAQWGPRPGLRRVINATGIVLHTNLGRAPLPGQALEAVMDIARGYSNLEFDLDSGERGSRQESVAPLICQVTGAESALVVNNNAAAVFLCLNTLASGREVLVSRGEQVEIGGSFRIPDVIASSGARMVEVGTTNKTHRRDYENAITERTAVILKIHTSNFKIIGFTSEVPLDQLVALGKANGLIVMEDLGSGSIVDLSSIGLPKEPTVGESLRAGADLVTFSGDKLLGGPQAGIIVGRKDLIARISRNPLARAVRVDKMTLAALEAIFRIYRRPEMAVEEIPTLRLLTRSLDELQRDAERLAALISNAIGGGWSVRVIDDVCEAGGGSLPGASIPSKAVALSPREHHISPSTNTCPCPGTHTHPGGHSRVPRVITVRELQAELRQAFPPIVARIHKDELLFNVRTLLPGDAESIAAAISRIAGGTPA